MARRERDWNRFALIALGFLAYEAALIAGLGQIVDSGTALVAVTLFLFAAAGYFLLGLLSRTWLSLPFCLVPVLVAVNVDVPSNVTSLGGDGESVPLFVSWVFLSAIFLPVWAFGMFVGDLNRPGRVEGGSR